MMKFKTLFPKTCSVIGMIHVEALPGTPLYGRNMEKVMKKACLEAEIYLKSDLSAVLVENMHDVPYIQSKHFGPEVTASMTRACLEIRKLVPKDIPCGIQILSCGNREALAIAQACSFNFIRAEGYVFSHIGDEGFCDAEAGILLRYRKALDAEDILVFADIKKKHSSHAITSDITLAGAARAAEYFLADGLVLTGLSTGMPANPKELTELRTVSKLPLLIGSGVSVENIGKYLQADALIVGSHFKKNGVWSNDVDLDRVKKFMSKIKCIAE